jgi:hypothetical protein
VRQFDKRRARRCCCAVCSPPRRGSHKSAQGIALREHVKHGNPSPEGAKQPRSIRRTVRQIALGAGSCVGQVQDTRAQRGVVRRARSARVSRPRRLARPTGLPRSSQTQVSEVFVLAKLTPNEGDLSVKHLGGVRRPVPSACEFQGGVEQTTAQHQNLRFGLVSRAAARTINGERPRRLSYGSDRLTMPDRSLSLAHPPALLHNR